MFTAALLCIGMGGALIFKALNARKSNAQYLWSWWDGGLMMNGKETSPTPALVGGAALIVVGLSSFAFAFFR